LAEGKHKRQPLTNPVWENPGRNVIRITRRRDGSHGERSEIHVLLGLWGVAMHQGDAEIFKMFQFELKFLEDGGYRHSPRTPWRAPYVFEDSPSCINFQDAARPHPCSECLLMEFVPSQFRDESAPCRFVPLPEARESVDYFYRSGTQMELEGALACWLRKQIKAKGE